MCRRPLFLLMTTSRPCQAVVLLALLVQARPRRNSPRRSARGRPSPWSFPPTDQTVSSTTCAPTKSSCAWMAAYATSDRCASSAFPDAILGRGDRGVARPRCAVWLEPARIGGAVGVVDRRPRVDPGGGGEERRQRPGALCDGVGPRDQVSFIKAPRGMWSRNSPPTMRRSWRRFAGSYRASRQDTEQDRSCRSRLLLNAVEDGWAASRPSRDPSSWRSCPRECSTRAVMLQPIELQGPARSRWTISRESALPRRARSARLRRAGRHGNRPYRRPDRQSFCRGGTG